MSLPLRAVPPLPRAAPAPRPTWAQLARLELQLAALLVEARAVDSGDNPRFCANRVWYRDFKPRLLHLVGWGVKGRPGAHPVLTTSEAYGLATQTIYDALPGCRGCWCIDPEDFA